MYKTITLQNKSAILEFLNNPANQHLQIISCVARKFNDGVFEYQDGWLIVYKE